MLAFQAMLNLIKKTFVGILVSGLSLAIALTALPLAQAKAKNVGHKPAAKAHAGRKKHKKKHRIPKKASSEESVAPPVGEAAPKTPDAPGTVH